MVDARKELSLIDKHVRQRNREAGEHLVWFEFLPFAPASASAGQADGWSHYDEIYDQGSRLDDVGGRSYAPGVTVPTIYVEEYEDAAQANEEGRQPTQNLHVVMLYKDVEQAGITSPYEYKAHLNDMFYYDGRYFKVHQYMARGRLGKEVLVTMDGFEVYLDQEFMFDDGPTLPSVQDLPWPTTFPG